VPLARWQQCGGAQAGRADGQGWTRLINDETTAATTRTAIIDTPARLAAAIAETRGYAQDLGCDPSEITVQVESREGRIWADEPVLHRHHERVGELAEAGATWFVVDPPADDAEKGLDAVRRYGAEVIAALAP
jgi:hypothetical protein